MPMRYKIAYRSSFERDLKSYKKDKSLKEAIKQSLEKLVDNPTIGIPLVSQWSGFYKFPFHDRPSLRILYVIYPCCPMDVKEQDLCRFDDLPADDPESNQCLGMVEFVFVRTREECNNLYSKGRTYTDTFKRE